MPPKNVYNERKLERAEPHVGCAEKHVSHAGHGSVHIIGKGICIC